MTSKFAVVHEAEADFHTATELADRIFLECIEWLEEGTIAHHRIWVRQSVEGVPLT